MSSDKPTSNQNKGKSQTMGSNLLERYLNDRTELGPNDLMGGYGQSVPSNLSSDSESEEEQETTDDEDDDLVVSNRLVDLPDHACAYCGFSEPTAVVKCETCKKWFCNSKHERVGSHIVSHLVLAKHHVVSLHEKSDLGDTTLECYSCGNNNLFSLGFVPAKEDSYVVILCRLPCSQKKDARWDTQSWEPLIENRALLSWLVSADGSESDPNVRQTTVDQIKKLEDKWRSNEAATLEDIQKEEEEAKEEIVPILMRYQDAYQYQRSFAPLIERLRETEEALVEQISMERLLVSWDKNINGRVLATFALNTYTAGDVKINIADEVILSYVGNESEPWECSGFIIAVPGASQEEYTMELQGKDQKSAPTQLRTGFSAKFVWKNVTFQRIQKALKSFAVNGKSMSSYLYHRLLGHDINSVVFDVEIPKKLSIPGIADLNLSQVSAVRNVLQRPLSLIQGPPGTGKTVTSATIVYHLSKINKERVLVCAPSNIAVDHLTAKIASLGLKVVRLISKSREDTESAVKDMSLSALVEKQAQGKLKKLIALKSVTGELTDKDYQEYVRLFRKESKSILAEADVICCTCVGAGSPDLASFKFGTVLIDESTQATEPETLIPIVKGAKQIILVGDHKQLGPVILDKDVGEAGLNQSLFERLVFLGHVPIRLEVQYRMHPALSEFPSNVFYEGSLQDGVTSEERVLPQSTFPWPSSRVPMMFWANFGKEEISGSGTSYLNRIEAMNCEKAVTQLFKDGVQPSQIGVITPYEGQRAFIVQYMVMNGAIENKDKYQRVEVASIDSFQGREKDYIIFSCVRANEDRNIGFVRDPRRLNVALTRARYGLIILGNPHSLSRNKLWGQLLLHIREKGCLVEGPLGSLQPCPFKLNNAFNVNRNWEQRMPQAPVDRSETASLASFVTDGASYATGVNKDWTPMFTPASNQWPSLQEVHNSESLANSISALTNSFGSQSLF